MAKTKANSIPADCLPMCRTCCYRRHDDDAGFSMCHRYPPVIVSDSEGSTYSFAPIEITDWCGEYRRANND